MNVLLTIVYNICYMLVGRRGSERKNFLAPTEIGSIADADKWGLSHGPTFQAPGLPLVFRRDHLARRLHEMDFIGTGIHLSVLLHIYVLLIINTVHPF